MLFFTVVVFFGSLLLFTNKSFFTNVFQGKNPLKSDVVANKIVEDTTVTKNKVEEEKLPLDGYYQLDIVSPFYDGDVTISSSTQTSISYSISTVNMAHTGDLVGIAFRDVSTTSLVYRSNDFHKGEKQESCQVIILFLEKGTLKIETEDKKIDGGKDYLDGCSGYHGAHGSFFEDSLYSTHPKNSLPTLTTLGFTEADRNIFLKMNEDIIDVEVYAHENIRYDQNEDFSKRVPSAQKIVSNDIPNNFGYRIESANIYDGNFSCFSLGGGYCSYGAFLRNGKGGYWIMGDPISGLEKGKKFIYRTTEKAWKHKLPVAFQNELDRLGLTEEDVDFEK